MSPEWNAILFRLVDVSFRVTVFAGMVALILAAARVHSNSVRHAAWTTVLLAMLLMPVLPRFIPPIRISLPVPIAAIQDQITIPEAASLTSTKIMHDVKQEPVRWISNGPLPTPRGDRRLGWPFAVIIFYCTCVFILLSRAFLGFRRMSKVVRESKPVVREARIRPELKIVRVPIYESEIVAAPLTAGILSSRIILPVAWRKWSTQKLSAVLAHESSHVRRRDTLIALLSYLNCCLFWFHPLAWWLERKLATMAELASDDDAVLSVGEAKLYAQVLLDMAQAVRRRGGRLVWQGIGVNGNGFLSQRIERLLCSHVSREISIIRKAVVAIGCAVAIFFVAACRQESAATVSEENPLAVKQSTQRYSLWAKRLLIITDPVNAPLEFGAGTGVQGLDIEVGNEIAKDLAIQVKWVKGINDYDHLFELLKKGEAEILLSAIVIDPAKSADFEFSKPYYETGDVIAHQRSRRDITDLASLSGKKVGVAVGRPGDAFMAMQKTASGVQIEKYSTMDDALGTLNRGEIDAVVGDEPLITYSSIKSFQNTTTIPMLINRYRYAAAVKKGKAELLAKINATIDRLKSTGVMNKLDEKWLGNVRIDRDLRLASLKSRNP